MEQAVKYLMVGSMMAVALLTLADRTTSIAKERGQASYYRYHKNTASGERFDPGAATCAHKTVRFNTKIRVTNLKNGRSVVCRVNDRGPFIRNRVIDLSPAGARAIGMIESGVAPVALEILN
jgi:rare lipoprotein A